MYAKFSCYSPALLPRPKPSNVYTILTAYTLDTGIHASVRPKYTLLQAIKIPGGQFTHPCLPSEYVPSGHGDNL